MKQPSPRVRRSFSTSWMLWGAAIVVVLGIAGGLYWSGSSPTDQTGARDTAGSGTKGSNGQTGAVNEIGAAAGTVGQAGGDEEGTSRVSEGSRSDVQGGGEASSPATDGTDASGNGTGQEPTNGVAKEDGGVSDGVSSTSQQPASESVSAVGEAQDDPDTDARGQEQQAIIAAQYKKLSALKSRCQSSVQTLMSQAKQSIEQAEKDGDDAAAGQEKRKLLASVIRAEGSCKSQFDQIVADASGEFAEQGISSDVIKGWEQEYNAARQESYDKAMEQLQSMIN